MHPDMLYVHMATEALYPSRKNSQDTLDRVSGVLYAARDELQEHHIQYVPAVRRSRGIYSNFRVIPGSDCTIT